ncbi:IS630 family transposase [Desulfococcaceae bacterium HSG7]|nr:IS630 family transposase [Desulfococcaceae bacterium HSG7]
MHNSIRIKITKKTGEELETMYNNARKSGDLRLVDRIRAVFAVFEEGYNYPIIASILKVSAEAIRIWIKKFILKGPKGLKDKKIPGRPSKLTKTQKKELVELILKGPAESDFPGACQRGPMIQDLIKDRFGVFYNACYISRLLRNLGLTFQKAKFVSDHLDPEKRKERLENKQPEIFNLSKEKKTCILFGDEASFPQWGSLSRTYGLRGKQPVVKTSGTRKAYKVSGLTDCHTGRFFCKGHEGRLNSEVYAAFLKEVLRKTRKHIILIQDGASYHRSKAMKAFFDKNKKRLSVFRLPSCSPDYNPLKNYGKKLRKKRFIFNIFLRLKR